MKKILIDARFWGPKHTGLGRYSRSLVTALYQLKPKGFKTWAGRAFKAPI